MQQQTKQWQNPTINPVANQADTGPPALYWPASNQHHYKAHCLNILATDSQQDAGQYF